MPVIFEVKTDKKKYLELLLLADEQESMIDRYIERGDMYVMKDKDVIAECIVTDEGGGVLELKSIAVAPEYQRHGYGKALIKFVEDRYCNQFKLLKVGTGDSPLTLPFYKSCGFKICGKVKNFFTDNYDHPIFEGGIQLRDMIYLQKKL